MSPAILGTSCLSAAKIGGGRIPIRRGALALVGALSILVSGCATVRPWQRELHAKRCMQINPDPTATALQQHVLEYREGASGGYEAIGGSGCGCN